MKKPQAPSSNKSRSQKAQDAEDWRRVARTVTPYADKPASNKKTISEKPLEKPAQKSTLPTTPATTHKTSHAKGFDASTSEKLRKGKLSIEARLDLHGMTQAQAHAALRRFIAMSIRQEKRTVLVITGKGRLSEQGGVLRRMLPLWLEDETLAPHIVAITQAVAKDGGSGAFYLRLRKRRDV